MLKTILVALLSFNVFFSNGSGNLLTETNPKAPEGNTGTLQKMIAASGSVAMELDLNKLNGTRARAKTSKPGELRFDVERDSFFNVMVFNNELRGAMPGSMAIIPQSSAMLPAKLNASYGQLVIEHMPFGGQYELVVRDAKTGFIFFNIEGHEYNYDGQSAIEQRLVHDEVVHGHQLDRGDAERGQVLDGGR